MPHYADGTECKVGDHVTGRVFNTEGTVAGTVVSITPGAESCNAKVRFTKVVPAGTDTENPQAPRMAVGKPNKVHSEAHGSSGPEVLVFDCEDYTDTKNLTKVA